MFSSDFIHVLIYVFHFVLLQVSKRVRRAVVDNGPQSMTVEKNHRVSNSKKQTKQGNIVMPCELSSNMNSAASVRLGTEIHI